MGKMRIKLLAFEGAPISVYEKGKKKVEEVFPSRYVEYVEENPEVLFFLTGGSEEQALKLIERRGRRFYLLLASKDNNAYASATEVKSWLNQNLVKSRMIQIGVNGSVSLIESYLKARKALWDLEGRKVGLLGKPSPWLVASTIPYGRLRDWLGLDLIQIEWGDFDPTNYPIDDSFNEHFSPKTDQDLSTSSAVYSFLKDQIEQHHLDGLTVECFPLVKEKGVTACLALSLLNEMDIPAGCEGDITSITGMFIARALTNQIPWMANTVEVDDKRSMFAHCTIATGLVNDYSILPHFETGKGTAIQGDYKYREVTIFRVNRNLEKGFVTSGMITHNPTMENACLTQVKVQLPPEAVDSLRNNPLGNHHLFIPGNFVEEIKMIFELIGMEIV